MRQEFKLVCDLPENFSVEQFKKLIKFSISSFVAGVPDGFDVDTAPDDPSVSVSAVRPERHSPPTSANGKTRFIAVVTLADGRQALVMRYFESLLEASEEMLLRVMRDVGPDAVSYVLFAPGEADELSPKLVWLNPEKGLSVSKDRLPTESLSADSA